jgi:hypothetical protein
MIVYKICLAPLVLTFLSLGPYPKADLVRLATEQAVAKQREPNKKLIHSKRSPYSLNF